MKKRITYTLDTSGLDKLISKHPKKVDQMLGKLAGDMDGQIKEDYSNTAPDPSQPGHPPAVQTGRLKNTVIHQKKKEGLWETSEGTKEVDYGPLLESGTRKMKARPHFMRAFYIVIKAVEKKLLETIEDLL